MSCIPGYLEREEKESHAGELLGKRSSSRSEHLGIGGITISFMSGNLRSCRRSKYDIQEKSRLTAGDRSPTSRAEIVVRMGGVRGVLANSRGHLVRRVRMWYT